MVLIRKWYTFPGAVPLLPDTLLLYFHSHRKQKKYFDSIKVQQHYCIVLYLGIFILLLRRKVENECDHPSPVPSIHFEGQRLRNWFGKMDCRGSICTSHKSRGEVLRYAKQFVFYICLKISTYLIFFLPKCVLLKF